MTVSREQRKQLARLARALAEHDAEPDEDPDDIEEEDSANGRPGAAE